MYVYVIEQRIQFSYSFLKKREINLGAKGRQANNTQKPVFNSRRERNNRPNSSQHFSQYLQRADVNAVQKNCVICLPVGLFWSQLKVFRHNLALILQRCATCFNIKKLSVNNETQASFHIVSVAISRSTRQSTGHFEKGAGSL